MHRTAYTVANVNALRQSTAARAICMTIKINSAIRDNLEDSKERHGISSSSSSSGSTAAVMVTVGVINAVAAHKRSWSVQSPNSNGPESANFFSLVNPSSWLGRSCCHFSLMYSYCMLQ